MGLNRVSLAVEEVYEKLDEHITQTRLKTGMRCSHLCNLCCSTTNIEASPIEFIPLASWLYETGKVDEFLIHLEKSSKTGHCPLFARDAWKEGKGGCLNYAKRGLVCRLFGFGYRPDRDGLAELVTCKTMKDSIPAAVSKARQLGIEAPEEIPFFGNYAMQLYSIDPDLAIQHLPINQAIRLAIEKLYFHYLEGVNLKDAK